MTSIENTSADRIAFQHALTKVFSDEQLRQGVSKLEGVEWDDLRGDSKEEKVRELTILLERQGRLEELASAMSDVWFSRQPDQKDSSPSVEYSRSALESLRSKHKRLLEQYNTSVVRADDFPTHDLVVLRQQLDELQQSAVTEEGVQKQIQEMVETTTRAIDTTDDLTARMILPPSELTDQLLAPVSALARLEEYRSDENWAFLGIGASLGFSLGIIANWVTSEVFAPTRVSIILLGLFIFLTLLGGLWVTRIRNRTNKVKAQIFSHQIVDEV